MSNLTPATVVLLVTTVLVSFASFGSEAVFRRFALYPYGVAREGNWHQTITSGFLHADLTHLGFNMITLFFFGPTVERYLGTPSFLIVYFGSMLVGSLVTFVRKKEDPRYRAIGASGAISGVLFAFVLMAPFQKIYLLLVPIGIPAVLFALGYIAVSAFGMKQGRGRIGHDAHLGGALAGLVLTIALSPQTFSSFLSQIRSVLG
ncbi:MAG: rhomboid family intramembrane serine protease [Candidatus Eisenbacteria bacterium]|uniref:Rhomboid family intramembrane serine protease n=1 Tax=Eiseniibacteriota bacterium TaxID=2212470 RepID=A0A956NG52_UNCEI|nr:rhomboid family intramembrane serine protease [Candidatus Eisenbacteria bacterium]